MKKCALIVGITGQDGAYLAKLLLGFGYDVYGSSRDSSVADLSRLGMVGVAGDVEMVSIAPNDFRSVLRAVSKIEPSEIYNLSGQTSVGLSFSQPVECLESISGSTLNFLEVIRFLGGDIKFFSAGSSEVFGDVQGKAADEESPFRPRSPYAVAKAAAFWQVANYREAYGIPACTGILANHESPLRPGRFVTQKIIKGVHSIASGKSSSLQLGNLDVWRDWGWAPEYVEAMHLMLQVEKPRDYLIASGRTVSLRSFVDFAFSMADLDSSDFLELRDDLRRPSDLAFSYLNPAKIEKDLGWRAQLGVREIVKKMYDVSLF